MEWCTRGGHATTFKAYSKQRVERLSSSPPPEQSRKKAQVPTGNVTYSIYTYDLQYGSLQTALALVSQTATPEQRAIPLTTSCWQC